MSSLPNVSIGTMIPPPKPEQNTPFYNTNEKCVGGRRYSPPPPREVSFCLDPKISKIWSSLT